MSVGINSFNDIDLVISETTEKGLRELAQRYLFEIGKDGRQPKKQWARDLWASQRRRFKAAHANQSSSVPLRQIEVHTYPIL
ncbi:hypothetical protein GGF32_007158 [Allomyces javanicus]|nr:hypothetical protein GGF32_007158 [Allomyces javanicus]